MSRQQTTPIFIPTNGVSKLLVPAPADWNEAVIRDLLQQHPDCLPITEIDPIFADPIPLCCEMQTHAGQVDNVMVTSGGLPVLIECKLWRNPQARREVIGQILDYAKELSRWTASDLQREVASKTGKSVVDLVRAEHSSLDEIAFNDALTLNLRRGRILLLIVGDGIREGVEAIAQYLQAHSGLHFTLGLVEMPVYDLPEGGGRLVTPRVLARTELITRTVITTPDGMRVVDGSLDDDAAEEMPDELGADRHRFWTAFVDGLTFDDPDQAPPRVTRQGYVFLPLPMRSGAPWVTIFRNVVENRVGVFLSYTSGSAGERVVRAMLEDWVAIATELGGTAHRLDDKRGRTLIEDVYTVPSLTDPAHRADALNWLRTRANDFVNVLRPRVRSVAAELTRDDA